jgi:hypothetical protein
MQIDDIIKRYEALKAHATQYQGLWNDIARYAGIRRQPNDINGTQAIANERDQFIDDTTAATSINKSAGYLFGLVWGTGGNVCSLVPHRNVTDEIEKAVVSDYYKYASEQVLYYMNSSESGLDNALRSALYDFVAYGNCGIGCFENPHYKNGNSDSPLIYRSFSIENTVFDEGINGEIDYSYTKYKWRINKIVAEFCLGDDGNIDAELLAKLPEDMQEAYKQKSNNEFDLIYCFYPREDYNRKAKAGRLTMRYEGGWIYEKTKQFLRKEDYKSRPIIFMRQNKLSNEIYGRSEAALILNTIKASNYVVGDAMLSIETQVTPPLGMLGNAGIGLEVLDTSPKSMTVFNPAFAGDKSPIFPISDGGNPAALVEFLIPYFREQITTAFKIDVLLDFNNQTAMTATESLQRGNIRDRSLEGMTGVIAIGLKLLINRSVDLLSKEGKIGFEELSSEATDLKVQERKKRIIPAVVSQVKAENKEWFIIEFNNELYKLGRTEIVANTIQILNSIMSIAGIYPQIIEAINWHKMLSQISTNLQANNDIVKSEYEFMQILAQLAQKQQMAQAAQMGQAVAGIGKDAAMMNKLNGETNG